MKDLLIIISVIICHFQGIAQSDNLPDLTFEKKLETPMINEPINLEIRIKNIGNTISQPTTLSIYPTYSSVTASDIERLNLKLVDTDFFFKMYRITRSIPALKPNEVTVVNVKLDKKYTEDCSFFIQIDREEQLKEANRNNNKIAFPESKRADYQLLPDLVVKKIHSPQYDYIDSTILTIEVQNVGFCTAENVILNAWEITTVLPNVPERDLKALLGETWWVVKGKKSTEPMFDISGKLGDIPAGESVKVTIKFKGWIYNPDCKIGVEVKTTTEELNNYNNAKSFIDLG